MKFCPSAGRNVNSTGKGSPAAISVYVRPFKVGRSAVVVVGSVVVVAVAIVEVEVEMEVEVVTAPMVVDVTTGSPPLEHAAMRSAIARSLNRIGREANEAEVLCPQRSGR
jgi:hypothetical protein